MTDSLQSDAPDRGPTADDRDRLQDAASKARADVRQFAATYIRLSGQLRSTLPAGEDLRRSYLQVLGELQSSVGQYTVLLRRLGNTPEATIADLERVLADVVPEGTHAIRRLLPDVVRWSVDAYHHGS